MQENSRKRPISAFTYRDNSVEKRTLLQANGNATDRGHLGSNPLVLNAEDGSNNLHATKGATSNSTFNQYNPYSSYNSNKAYTSRVRSLPNSRSGSRPVSAVRRVDNVFGQKSKKTKQTSKRPAWNDRFYINDGDNDSDPDKFLKTAWTTLSVNAQKSNTNKARRKGFSRTSSGYVNRRNRDNNLMFSPKTSEDEQDEEIDFDGSFQGLEETFASHNRASKYRTFQSVKDTGESIHESYESSKARIRNLWKETNVRYTERADFEKNYFMKHATHDIMETVFAYEQDLLHFRESTVKVLRMIEWREEHVNALKKYVDAYIEGDIPESGSAELRENLNTILTRIRNFTLNIVEGVMEWRSNMTHAKPFVFDGQNYLLKLQNDLNFFVESPIAAYASGLNQPFEEFNNPLGLIGVTPPRLNSHQKQYISATLPSLNQVDKEDDEWVVFRDRIYRAIYFLSEEVQRFANNDEALRAKSPNKISEPDSKGSFFDTSPPIKQSNHSPSSRNQRLHIKNINLVQNPTSYPITFKSHFEANERSGYATSLEPETSRLSQNMNQIGGTLLGDEIVLRQHQAATKLQSVFKGWQARKHLHNELRYKGKYVKKPLDEDTVKLMHEALRFNTIREDDFEKMALLRRLQSGIRTILSKSSHTKLYSEKNRAALKIQTQYRQWMAKKHAAVRRHQRNLSFVIKVQRTIRMVSDRARFQQKFRETRSSALFVQRVYRMQCACMRIFRESTAKSQSISVIVRALKHHVARKRFKVALERHRAAITIARVFRGHLGRKRATAMKELKSIIHVQSILRMNHVSNQVHEVLHVRMRLRRIVMHLQSQIRTIIQRRTFLLEYYQARRKPPLFRSKVEYIHPEDAAEIIQRAFRCYLSRKQARFLELEKEIQIEMNLQKEAQLKRIRNLANVIPLHMRIIHLDHEVSNTQT